MRRVLKEKDGMEVPCGDCSACCRSSLFIHIGPDEHQTLAAIPSELLFPAPGRPKGTMLMGFDKSGLCPMFIDDTCSIYENRPLSCRRFDCRIFPAAGLEKNTADKSLITDRAEKWRFEYADDSQRREHGALMQAARFLLRYKNRFPDHFVPNTRIQLAVLAVKIADVFISLADNACAENSIEDNPDAIIDSVIQASKAFEFGTPPSNKE